MAQNIYGQTVGGLLYDAGSDIYGFGRGLLDFVRRRPQSAGLLAGQFVPGAATADFYGRYPDPMNPSQMLPSAGQNIAQGNILDAAFQSAGLLGDAFYAAAPFTAGAAAIPGAALSAPRAAQLAKRAADGGNKVTAAKAPTNTEPGIIAFHGSGSDFDEFNLQKIGTGEGAAAYGHGLYFTSSEDIAAFYRQTVGGGVGIDDFSIGNLDLVRRGEYRDYSPGNTPFGKDKRYKKVQDLTAEDYAIASLSEDLFINEGALYNANYKDGAGVMYEPKEGKELQDAIVSIMFDTVKSKDPVHQIDEIRVINKLIKDAQQGKIKFDTTQFGKTYKVGLTPKADELLDHDAGIKHQPEAAQEILKKYYSEYGVAETADIGTLFATMKYKNAPLSKFSEDLASAGVPGLRYKAGQLTHNSDELEPATNYVIFDDKLIKVLEKYGIFGPVAVGAATTAGVSGGLLGGEQRQHENQLIPIF